MKDLARAREYAAAINLLTQRNFEDLLTHLRRVSEALRQAPSLGRFFDHPAIPVAEKLAVIDRISESREGLLSYMLRKLVARYDMKLLPMILEELELIRKKNQKSLDVVIHSAVALNDVQKSAVDKRLSDLTGMKILARHEIDPSLIGGLKMHIGDRIVDNTLRTRLESLSDQLFIASLQ